MGEWFLGNRDAPALHRVGPIDSFSPGLLPERSLSCVLERVSGPLAGAAPHKRGRTSDCEARPVSLLFLKKILKPKMPLAKWSFLFQRMNLLGNWGEVRCL